MKIKLKQLLDASDLEFINGYEVEGYHYPGDFSGIVDVTIEDGNDTEYTVDQQQEVELNEDGYAEVITLAGDVIRMRFKVVTTLTPSHFS